MTNLSYTGLPVLLCSAFHQISTLEKTTCRQVPFCGEVGLVIRLHLLSGEVRSVTTSLKVVEEVQEEVQEI